MDKSDIKKMEEAFEKVENMLERARAVVVLTDKARGLLEKEDFATRMSVINMLLAQTIAEESEDLREAMAYVARTMHTLVGVLDKAALDEDEEEGDDEGTLQ